MENVPKTALLLSKLMEGPRSRVAGVGSRELPSDKSALLFKAAFLSVLTEQAAFSSGGAPGSDATIEHGVKAALQSISDGLEYENLVNAYLNVYLPGYFFNGRSSKEPGMIDATKLAMHEQAKDLAKQVHPAFRDGKPVNPERPMKPYVLNLHARNGHQALGDDLKSPVRSVLCFTGDGAKEEYISSRTGGTGQALRLAHKFGIPALNIGNRSDEAKLDSWVQKRGSWLLQEYGIDVHKAHHEYVANFTSKIPHHVGDLARESASLGLDLIVHGCDCFNTTGTGVAKGIKDDFYEAYLADQNTVNGDRKKLGTYSSAEFDSNGKTLTVINAYTQYKYNHREDGGLDFDYKAFEKVLKSLNENYPGSTVGFSRIGTEGAGGCWLSIAEMIRNKAPRLNAVIVSNESDLEYKPAPTRKNEREGDQIGLNL